MKGFIFPAIVAICAISCVNNDYDLSKLNKEMTLFEEEGIEIPLPESEPANLQIFNGNKIPDNLLHVVSESLIEAVDLSEIASGQIDKGIDIDGEFRFDFSGFPDSFRTEGTKIEFKNGTFFSINLDNETSVPMSISCDVLDEKSNKSWHMADASVPVGNGKEFRIYLSQVGMTYLPEEVVIKNIVLKPLGVKSDISGILKFIGAYLELDSIIGKDSKLAYSYEFSDFFSETGINIDALKGYLDAKSFMVKATLTSNLPVLLTGSAEGDITTSIELEGPTPDNGTQVTINIKCPGGLASAKKIKLKINCSAKDDIDLLNIDTYHVSVSPESIKLDEGIIVNL